MLPGQQPIGALPVGATTAIASAVAAAKKVIKGLIVDLRNMMGR